jgi:hypothetical protein
VALRTPLIRASRAIGNFRSGLIDQFVAPSVRRDAALGGDLATQAQLVALLEEARAGASRAAAGIEPRMVPSIAPKAHRVPFKSRP